VKAALLVTADGAVFRGVSVGADGVTTGEAVFNTAMTGYQEVLSDPSYAGQVVVMTSAHIGNYGATPSDDQAKEVVAAGMVMRTLAGLHSSWRAESSFADHLARREVVALADVDTRRLTRHIRNRGAMPVAMGTDHSEAELASLAAEAPTMSGQALAYRVSTNQPYHMKAEGERRALVVAIDLGLKRDILSQLVRRGVDVRVVPATTSASSILNEKPDGVFLSNGPGDPEPLTPTVESLRALVGQVPVFGICLGHQVLGLALGARTYKLPFGHHGGNHPVRNLESGRVAITSQNHGFAVDLTDLKSPFGDVLATHQNLNDGTLEGMRATEVRAFSVQFHPEAAPGPHDAVGLFDDFLRLMDDA
jgi:carbamoyl-phosphate synthase small subunit